MSLPEEPFVSSVLGNPRLSALLPRPDELDALQASHARASEHLRTVKLPLEIDDVRSEVAAAIQSGKDLPPLFGARVLDAERAREEREVERRMLGGIATDYLRLIIGHVESSTAALYDGLDDQLHQVLDEGQTALDALGAHSTAEEAIEAGQAASWRDLAVATRRYSEIRADQMFLATSEEPSFDTDKYGIYWSWFEGLGLVWPSWRNHQVWETTEGNPREAGWSKPVSAPFSTDASSLDHFRWVVSHRKQARPWVASPDVARVPRVASAKDHSLRTPATDGGIFVRRGSFYHDYLDSTERTA